MPSGYSKSVDGIKREKAICLVLSPYEIEVVDLLKRQDPRAEYFMSLVVKDGISRGILKKNGRLKEVV